MPNPIQATVDSTEETSHQNSGASLECSLNKQQKSPQPTKTIIFLDWDDTLLCSSVLSRQGIKLDTDISDRLDLLAELEQLSDSIINFLDTAGMFGEVHIVTNGQTGWVELSAQKFIPRVVPVMEKWGISVVSARDAFEDSFPGKPMEWKFHTFEQSLLGAYSVQCVRNILSFGDSRAEREAIQNVTRGLPDTRCKSVKFIEHPTIEQLRRQQELVSQSFSYLRDHGANLDLCLSPSGPLSATSEC